MFRSVRRRVIFNGSVGNRYDNSSCLFTATLSVQQACAEEYHGNDTTQRSIEGMTMAVASSTSSTSALRNACVHYNLLLE